MMGTRKSRKSEQGNFPTEEESVAWRARENGVSPTFQRLWDTLGVTHEAYETALENEEPDRRKMPLFKAYVKACEAVLDYVRELEEKVAHG